MTNTTTKSPAKAVALLSSVSDTCQELLRMDQLLDALPDAIRLKAEGEESEGSSLKNIGIRATIDAPSVFWMVKGAPGYDKTYYKSTNNRVCDAAIKSTRVAPDNADQYSARVRNYAAEWVLGQVELGQVVDAAGVEVEIPDVVFDKLIVMADRTPAGLARKAADKKAKEAAGENTTRADDIRCHEKIVEALKIALKSEGAWAVKYIKALKGLVSPEEMADAQAKADKAAK